MLSGVLPEAVSATSHFEQRVTNYRSTISRIWVFSKGNIYIVGFLTLGCIAPLILDWITSFHIINDPVIAHFPSFTKEVVALFSIGAGGELFNRPRSLEQSSYAIKQLIL